MNIDESLETRLLIIPMGEAKEYEIMDYEEEIAELCTNPSSSCILHNISDLPYTKTKRVRPKRRRHTDKMYSRNSPLDINKVNRVGSMTINVIEEPTKAATGVSDSSFPIFIDERTAVQRSDDDFGPWIVSSLSTPPEVPSTLPNENEEDNL